ncbi:MAG TPA: cyclase family protein [Terracidiphilus sp.]|nr:cyclase family protein [Terracidiphilus sp.]
MFIKLSHNLSESTPFYSAMPGPSLDQIYDICKGDPCNSFYFTSSNHAGTHVDGPRHFNPEGRRIAEYDLSELVFQHVAVIDIDVREKHLIVPEDLTGCAALPDNCELLLLRTGFSRFRMNATKYVEESPGFSKAAALYLMERFKNLKALAVDFVSIAAMAHMDEGCEAHRVFLGCKGYSERSILLVEDALLPRQLPFLERAFLIPWFFDGLDSAPCTLFAETAFNSKHNV